MPPLPPNVDNTAHLGAFQAYLDAYNAKDALLNGSTANPAEYAELEFEDKAENQPYLTVEELELAAQNAQSLLNIVQSKVDSYDAIMAENAFIITEYFTLYPDSLGIYFPLTDQSISVYLGIVTVYSGEPVAPPVFSPADVPGLFMWQIADIGVTEGSGAGTGVSQWDDQSGNGNYLKATGSLKPAWDSVNNKIVFSGSHCLETLSLPFSVTDDLTIFCVFQNKTSGLGIMIETSANVGSTNGFIVDLNENADGEILLGSNGNIGLDTIRIPATKATPILLRAQAWRSNTGKDSALYIDGSNMGFINGTTADNTTNFSNNILYFGARGAASFFITADVYEFLIYSEAPTPTDILAIEDYLKDKYGL